MNKQLSTVGQTFDDDEFDSFFDISPKKPAVEKSEKASTSNLSIQKKMEPPTTKSEPAKKVQVKPNSVKAVSEAAKKPIVKPVETASTTKSEPAKIPPAADTARPKTLGVKPNKPFQSSETKQTQLKPEAESKPKEEMPKPSVDQGTKSDEPLVTPPVIQTKNIAEQIMERDVLAEEPQLFYYPIEKQIWDYSLPTILTTKASIKPVRSCFFTFAYQT
jgi:hypothetical protein